MMTDLLPLEACGLQPGFFGIASTEKYAGFTWLIFTRQRKLPIQSETHWDLIGVCVNVLERPQLALRFMHIEEDMLTDKEMWPQFDTLRDAPCYVKLTPERIKVLVQALATLRATVQMTPQEVVRYFTRVYGQDLTEGDFSHNLFPQFQLAHGAVYESRRSKSTQQGVMRQFLYLSDWFNPGNQPPSSTLEVLTFSTQRRPDYAGALGMQEFAYWLTLDASGLDQFIDILDDHLSKAVRP